MSSKIRVAMLLAGSGNRDGSEIHESVCAIIAADKKGWEILFTAPDTPQSRTVSYLNGKELPSRNAMDESGRIARGSVVPLRNILISDIDAVLIPGGLGVATTLCDFAVKGSSCTAHPEVENFIKQAHSSKIPIGAMCIAPALVARCLPGATVTIGNDKSTAEKIVAMGCHHIDCAVDSSVVDTENRVVTTPAYMSATGAAQVLKGAESMVAALEKLIRN